MILRPWVTWPLALGLASPAFAGETGNASGPYIGIQSGGLQLVDHYYGSWVGDPISTWDEGTHSATSGVGGIHGGYVRQIGRVLIGGEADLEVPGSKVAYGFDTWTYSSKIAGQGSIRLRLGVAAGPAQVYATGGLALAEVKNTYLDPVFNVDNRLSRLNAGYTVGGGLGYRVTKHVTIRLEYRFTDFGALSTDVNTGWGTIDTNHDKSHALRAGVSLRL
jgi:outer membrane immunogenic protein